MRYSIMGFNQEALLSITKQVEKDGKITTLELDVSDTLILNYIMTAAASPSMQKIQEDNYVYVWIKRSKLLEDLPILNIKEIMLSKRLEKLVELKLLKRKTVTNEAHKGSKSYYAITEMLEKAVFSDIKNCTSENTTTYNKLYAESDTTYTKLYAKTESDIKNYTSDSKLNSNNKLNKDSKLNTISKDIVPKNSEIKNTSTFNKPKKQNLYDKCVNVIDDYLTDFADKDKLKELLITYLSVRLSIKDKPMYLGQWKGLLKKLLMIREENNYSEKQLEKVIMQSIERGYASFYELYNPKAKDNRENFAESSKVKSRAGTEQEIQEEKELIEKLKANGEQWEF